MKSWKLQNGIEKLHPSDPYGRVVCCLWKLIIEQDLTVRLGDIDMEENGVTSALYNYGIYLERKAFNEEQPGLLTSAVRYLRKAASRRHPDAQWRLFQLLRLNRKQSTTSMKIQWKNDVEAFHWCEQAAEQGHKEALHFLLNFDEVCDLLLLLGDHDF